MQTTQIQRYFSPWIFLSAITLGTFWSTCIQAATMAEIQEWLQKHNTYRTLHSVPSVTWSDTVAASAQAWADSCPSTHSGSGYGENIAWATSDIGEDAVVQLWYDEEPDYDYNNPGFSSDTGHFTQVVWKGTTEIGCGYKTGCTTGWANVWVCQYNPPGNYIGQFAENVFPPNPGNDGGGEGTPPAGEATVVPVLPLMLLK